ncbi:hypothetical protein IW262DRAFT_1280247, partial [Armillaria fumosa]
ERVKNFRDEVHSDLWRPSPVKTQQHKEYYISYTNDHSHFLTIFLVRAKSTCGSRWRISQQRILYLLG